MKVEENKFYKFIECGKRRKKNVCIDVFFFRIFQ